MTSTREIVYLSPPAAVSMADRWYEIASLNHFWVRRRFDVFQRLAGHLVPQAAEMAEIGCGSGLLQRQIEDRYSRKVTGFDLNEFALRQNISRLSEVCCYDICKKDPSLRSRFDLIFLLDVLEHIDDEVGFLTAILHHLAPVGYLIVNVPAGQCVYSAYDRAAGHKRRYSFRSFRSVVQRSGLSIVNWTYWGLPLLPLVVLRKLWLAGQQDNKKTITAGFDSRSGVIDRFLWRVANCEVIPQTLAGASLMAVLRVETGRKQRVDT
jgi:SAM-dependent methyltransferase